MSSLSELLAQLFRDGHTILYRGTNQGSPMLSPAYAKHLRRRAWKRRRSAGFDRRK